MTTVEDYLARAARLRATARLAHPLLQPGYEETAQEWIRLARQLEEQQLGQGYRPQAANRG